MENNGLITVKGKELVAAGHKFAANISADTPLIDMAKMVSELATQLDAALAAAAEACKQRDTVATENAALKGFGDKLNDMHNKLNGEGTGIQGRAEVACQQVALEAAMDEFDTIITPATDAYLNAVRAEVLENVPTVCDGKEQLAFEAYASSKGLDLSKHPLHYLFLDGKTNQARSAWRECLVYVAAQLLAGNAGKDGV